MASLLEGAFEVAERGDARLFVFANPAPRDLVDRSGVEIVQLLPPAPHGDDEVRRLEHRKVLGDGLPGHGQVLTELAEGLPIARAQSIEEQPPARVGERFEDEVHLAGQYATLRSP